MSEENTSQTNTEDVQDTIVTEKREQPTQEKDMAETFYSKDEEGKTESSEQEGESTEDQTEDKKEGDSKEDDPEKESDKDKSESESESEDEKEDEDYDLKLPEESHLSDADKERIAEYAKKQGLSKEAAQQLIDDENSARAEFVDSFQEKHKEIVSGWVEQIKEDKELGGEKFKESVEFARRAVDRFGNEELKDALERSGYGNHPELARFCARIGRAMGNDQTVFAGDKGSSERSMEDIFYGNKN